MAIPRAQQQQQQQLDGAMEAVSAVDDGQPAAAGVVMLSGAVRDEMTARWRKIVLTSDFNRGLRDPVRGLSQYTMEELMRYCDVILPLLWHQTSPEVRTIHVLLFSVGVLCGLFIR
jgi:hypothetical protein